MGRVGVIGLGSIGLRHAKNALSLKYEVFGFDPDEGRQALLSSYGGIPCSKQSVQHCDFAVIATPTPNHWEDIQALGIKTLAEKPIADKPVDDLDLSHVELVGYNLRYHACVKQAKQWIDTGQIGKILHGNFILAQFNAKPAYLRDGVLLNWSHEIDLSLYLLGSGTSLATVCKNNTVADVFIQHKGGTVSSVHLNYLNRREERYFEILGDRGRIRCVLSPYRSAECWPEDGSVIAYTYGTTFDEDYVTEMKAFLSGDIGPGCTAQQAVEVLNICLGV